MNHLDPRPRQRDPQIRKGLKTEARADRLDDFSRQGKPTDRVEADDREPFAHISIIGMKAAAVACAGKECTVLLAAMSPFDLAEASLITNDSNRRILQKG